MNILIISVKAGAGHLRAAEAIERHLKDAHPDITTNHIEALSLANPAYRKLFTGTYEKLVKTLPSVWGQIYESLEKKSVNSRVKKMTEMLDRFNSRKLLKTVRGINPDVIICTHYLPAEILSHQRRKQKLTSRLYIILTDYDIHTMWIQNGADGYFVATDDMAFALSEKGIGNADVITSGIPVLTEFSRKYPSKRMMRKRLGLKEQFTTALMSAGGFGLNGIDQTVGNLAGQLEGVQILAVAGKNQKLYHALEQVAKKHPKTIIPFGFVTNMHELMAASDLFVGKCGGLTSSECMAMGLPMIILNPIPGQEERNADCLMENGIAVKANSQAHLIFKFRKLVSDIPALKKMQRAARKTARPHAAQQIVNSILGDL